MNVETLMEMKGGSLTSMGEMKYELGNSYRGEGREFGVYGRNEI